MRPPGGTWWSEVIVHQLLIHMLTLKHVVKFNMIFGMLEFFFFYGDIYCSNSTLTIELSKARERERERNLLKSYEYSNEDSQYKTDEVHVEMKRPH